MYCMNAGDVKALFGKRVRELRKGRGFSQEAFAQATGLDRSYYGKIERGERNVSLENIHLIARSLDIPLAELFQFDPVGPNKGESSSSKGNLARGNASG